MIDVASEKSKVGSMKIICSDLSDEAIKLANIAKKVPDVFQTDVATNEIENLLNKSSGYKDHIDSTSGQVDSLNGIIDDVYAEELAEQQAQASKNSKTNLEEDDSEDSSDSNNSNSGTSNYSDGVLIINNYE